VGLTGVGLTLAQVVTVRWATSEPLSQTLVEPWLTVVVELLVVPALVCCSTMAGQVVEGFSLSPTVTVAVQVCSLPFRSVTVRVTGLGPTLTQVKVLGVTLIEAMPQASVEPLLICAAVMLALPVASSCTVMS